MYPDQDDRIFEAWKPLRNFLRQLDVNDTLATIRWYYARRQANFDPPIPSDLEPHPFRDRPNSFLPFELETLAREAIISCGFNPNAEKSFRKIVHISNGYNKMKDLDNRIAVLTFDQTNVLDEMNRLAHRQFKYQTERPNLRNIIRYSMIYRDDEVHPFVVEKTGMTMQQISTIGYGLWGLFNQAYGIPVSKLTSELGGISDEDVQLFVEHYSKTIPEMRELLTAYPERRMNDEFFYGYSSMYSFPLLKTINQGEESIVCPLPTLLFWKTTSSLYYDLIDMPHFDNAIGHAYERYIGKVLEKTLQGTDVTIKQGEPNNGRNPNTTDWVIDKQQETLLVENKVKRLGMAAKTKIGDPTAMEAQLKILAHAIWQAYKSLNAYRANAYADPLYTLPTDNKAYVSVITLERWYLNGHNLQKLRNFVKDELIASGDDVSIIDESPYVVGSTDDMEKMAHLLKTKKISEIIDPYNPADPVEHMEFGLYLSQHFKDELESYEYPFEDDLNDAFTIDLKNLKNKDEDDS